MAGVLVGVGLTFATAAFASISIRATLLPAVLHFHMNGLTSTVDGAKGKDVISYNGQTYVSVGGLAQAIGATIDEQATGSSGTGKRQFDVYFGEKADFGVADPNGIVLVAVSNANLVPVTSDLGDVRYSTVSGLVKLGQDMSVSRKRIDLTIRTTAHTFESQEFVIENPLNKPLKKGDIRPFTAYFAGDPQLPKTRLKLDGAELSVATEDIGIWTERQDGIQPGSGMGIGVPFHIVGGQEVSARKDNGNIYKAGEPISGIAIRVQAPLYNKPVTLQSSLSFAVEITNKTTGAVVRRVKLPALNPREYASYLQVEELNYVWDQKDSNGKPVKPGSYRITLKGPSKLDYSDNDSSETLTQNGYIRLIPFDVKIVR
ncbi:MAG: hypothetical protein J7559_21320 [Cohnella sp.]|nr:hypothetical protein [Cohnella sp.]